MLIRGDREEKIESEIKDVLRDKMKTNENFFKLNSSNDIDEQCKKIIDFLTSSKTNTTETDQETVLSKTTQEAKTNAGNN